MRARPPFLLLAIALAGCSAIRMQRIVPYTPATFEKRDPVLHSAWDANGNLNDRYDLRDNDDDEVALSLVDSSGNRGPRVTIHRDSLVFAADVDTARLTLRLLRALHTFKVANPPNAGMPVTMNPGDFTQWSALRQKLESVTINCGGGQTCSLRAVLEPRERVFVVPGDEVVVERSYVAPDLLGRELITVDSSHAFVDAEGWIDVLPVPAMGKTISTIGRQGDQDDDFNGNKVRLPALRLAGAEIAASYGRVRAWSPTAMHSLGEIGACLSVATLLPLQTGCSVPDTAPDPRVDPDALVLPAGFVSNCLAIGVDRHFATCPDLALNVHYRLATRLVWTLVDDRSARLVVPYRHGATVEDAVRREYVRARGRELVDRGLFGRRAYVSVVPDARGGETRRFYLRVTYGRRHPDALLQPNDVVFVSRSWPERLFPDWNGGDR